jgi:hypothetical protein
MNDEGRTTDKLDTAAGEIRKVLDNEIAAGLARLSVSREELLAEADLYPWVAEWPEVYEPYPVSVAFRARAVELLHCLINDGLSTCIEWLDKYIAELREVLPGAAGRPSPALAHQLKETAEKAAKEAEEEDEACACDPVVILSSARLDDFSH